MARERLDLSYYESFDRLSSHVLSLIERLIHVKRVWISHVDAENVSVLKMLSEGKVEVWTSREGSSSDARFAFEGKGLVASAGESKDSFNPRAPFGAESLGIGAYMGVPILLRDGQIFGALCAVDPDSASFSEKDVLVMTTMAKFLSHAWDLEQSVVRDPLTGLYNRNFLYRYFEHWRTLGQPRLAFLFCDLDHFRVINDNLGHTFGDQLLQLIAIRLQEIVGQEHVLARFGADEFVVLMGSLDDPRDAASLADRILDALKLPFELRGQEVGITASIGISFYPINGETMDELVKNADTAMYQAKGEGRNLYRFYRAKMGDTYAKRFQLETALRKAIANEELTLYYQPQVNPRTKEIVGVEALLRWNHPEMGFIPPVEFIPIAEETGLIIPLGEWVMRTAVNQNRRWIDAGFRPIVMSVNLSVRQLFTGNLVESVAKILQESGLDPKYLLIELTESIGLHSRELALSALKGLKNLGVQLSIDDFGTGFSSLSYLKQFPVDMLKIDRSFVADISHDRYDAAIVQAIVAMARGLNLNIIAEGVETEAQLLALEDHVCDAIQGYLFGKPVPVQEIEKLLIIRNRAGH